MSSIRDFRDIIHDINICYDISDEDHIPFRMVLAVKSLNYQASPTYRTTTSTLGHSDSDCLKYGNLTGSLLGKVNAPESMNCENIRCTNSEHVACVEKLYEDIIACLRQAGDKSFPKSQRSTSMNKPGWAELSGGN